MVNDTCDVELMQPELYDLAAAVLGFIQIFGFTSNFLVIGLMLQDSKIWTAGNIIIFNLACCDFSVSILGNPFAFVSALYHRWIFGQLGCQLYGFFMAFLGITSITTIAFVSFERFFLVRFPFSTYQLNNRGAKFCVPLIWLYALIVTSPPLFGWGAYVNEAANISCSVNWEEQSLNAKTYIIFLFVWGLFVPLIVITFCYISLYITLKQSSARVNRTSPAEKRVAKMVFIMFMAFMFAWTPYACFALVKQYGNPDLISPAMAVLPSIFAKSSICYNPIIYCYMNKQFRYAFNRLRGIKPPVERIMTVSTTANILDTDAKEARRNRVQAVNVHSDHREDDAANDIEVIEMNVINENDRRSVRIRT